MNTDTQTTAGKIAVMQHFAEGGEIEISFGEGWVDWADYLIMMHGGGSASRDPVWNWNAYDYRIKPKPREWNAAVHKVTGMLVSDFYAASDNCVPVRVREILE